MHIFVVYDFSDSVLQIFFMIKCSVISKKLTTTGLEDLFFGNKIFVLYKILVYKIPDNFLLHYQNHRFINHHYLYNLMFNKKKTICSSTLNNELQYFY